MWIWNAIWPPLQDLVFNRPLKKINRNYFSETANIEEYFFFYGWIIPDGHYRRIQFLQKDPTPSMV